MVFGIEEHVTKVEENQASFSTYCVPQKLSRCWRLLDKEGPLYTFSGALYLQDWVFAGVYGVHFPQNHFFLAAFTLEYTCLVNSHDSSDE